jgi:pimeloyl-ACP methyl ester carboxylesterase
MTVAQQNFAADNYQVTYRTVKVNGLNLFYREAGNPSRPTIVLLHGVPSSSHMYRNLIPKLAPKYHVVSPDYPGFGYSDHPSEAEFGYTFDHLAAVTDEPLDDILKRVEHHFTLCPECHEEFLALEKILRESE